MTLIERYEARIEELEHQKFAKNLSESELKLIDERLIYSRDMLTVLKRLDDEK